MSRFFALLIAFMLFSLALAACGGGGEEATPASKTPGGEPPTETVTIDLWHAETAGNLDTLERLVSLYNSSQNEVKVRPFYQGQELMTKLIASLPSRQVPAIVLGPEIDAQMMLDSGAVAPIQDFVDQEGYDLSDLDQKAVQTLTIQDKLWAMPFCSGVSLLFYNKVVFREVGLDPEKPPRDLEELRQYSQKILKRDDAGNVVRSGLALDILDWVERVFGEHGDLLVDNDNGRDGRATKVLFDNDTGRWLFQWWHDMVDEGLAFNVGRNPTYADALLAIVSGRAAMAFSLSSALRSVMDALGSGVPGIEVGVAPLPGVPGGTGAPLRFGGFLWIFNLRPEEEQEAAWKFIKWLMEPEQQAEWFAGTGYLPVSHSAIDQPVAKDVVAQYPLFQVALDQYMSSAAITPAALGAVLGPFHQVREALDQGVEAMLSGSADPEQALESAAAAANDAIEEYNERVGD
jgi:sn-glycerol 3-phosphate transport system substrate-binding protein